MIVRILGEGQFDISGEYLGELELLDAQLQSAAEACDVGAFTGIPQALRDAVRGHGAPVAADALVAFELVPPAENTSLDQVRALLAGEGLIPRVSGELTGFQPGRQMRPGDLACGPGTCRHG